jgi:HTH-type transcriptional regulator/antitoxin HipB
MGNVSVDLIGEAVRYHRRRGGLSQRDLADLAGVGKTSVFDIEKGKPTVRLATLVAVLSVLNVKIAIEGPLMDEFVATLPDRGDRSP